MNVDSCAVLADPLKVERLYYVLQRYLPPDLKHNRKSYDEIVQRAKMLTEEGKGFGALKKYVEYSELLDQHLSLLKNKKIIFLNGISTDLTVDAKPGRSGTDPFCHLFGLSRGIIEIFISLPSDVQEYVRENVVFWPIGPFDFPFYADENEIIHCFADDVKKLSDKLIEDGKIGFGSLKKSIDTGPDAHLIGNYQFNERLFDPGKLKKSLVDSPSMYAEVRKQFGDEKSFFRFLSRHVAVNRWLLAQKYKCIVKALELKELTTFFIKTSYAREVFDIVSKETGIPYDHILRNKKDITYLGERDPTYLNQLMGRLQNWAHDAGKELTPVGRIKSARKEPPRVNGGCGSCTSCSRHPLFRCELDAKSCSSLPRPRQCTADFIDQYILANESLKSLFNALENDAKKYDYGVLPLEQTLLLLNSREYEISVGISKMREKTSMLTEIEGRVLVPFPIRGMNVNDNECDMRASEFGSECPIANIFSRMDKEHYPIQSDMRFANIGIALHWIINQQPPDWDHFLHNKLLTRLGIPPLKRMEYCEKPILFEYDAIKVSGHPDAIAVLMQRDALQAYCSSLEVPKESDIFILDIKRAMHSAYEKRGYRKQLLCYALAIMQNEHMKPRNLYLTLIQTPFDPRRFLELAVPRIGSKEEAYRNPSYSIIKVPVNSEDIDMLIAEIKERVELKKRILNDNVIARAVKERSAENGLCKPSNRIACFDKPICDNVFKEMGKQRRMIEVLKQYGPYPSSQHRSELFKNKGNGRMQLPS